MIFEEKWILHFIRKMKLSRGGKFLKRSPIRGPLEAYIFIFWKYWRHPILRTSHPGSHSIKPVNWTAILGVTQSNQSTEQPSWLSLNQTSKLDSHPSCHSIKPVSESWRPVGWLEAGVWGGGSSSSKDQMTRRFPQQLWTSGGVLVQRAQDQISLSGNPSLR